MQIKPKLQELIKKIITVKIKKPSKKAFILAFTVFAVLFVAVFSSFSKNDTNALFTHNITRTNIEQSIEAFGGVFAKKQVQAADCV